MHVSFPNLRCGRNTHVSLHFMKFKELLLKCDKEKVALKNAERDISINSSDQKYTLENQKLGYLDVIVQLLNLKSRNSNIWTLIVERVENDPCNNYEPWDGHVYGIKKGSKETWAMEYTKWEHLLGMEVKTSYNIDDTIAYLLWELTFVGFSQEKIQDHLKELNKDAKEFKEK